MLNPPLVLGAYEDLASTCGGGLRLALCIRRHETERRQGSGPTVIGAGTQGPAMHADQRSIRTLATAFDNDNRRIAAAVLTLLWPVLIRSMGSRHGEEPLPESCVDLQSNAGARRISGGR